MHAHHKAVFDLYAWSLRLKRRAGILGGGALAALFGGFLLVGANQAMAQAVSWPVKPIKFIVGYPPGGGADIVARFVGERVAKTLGQPVVIENRSGAGGTIAATTVARSDADGYTFLAAASSEMTIAPATVKSPGYDVKTDFQPIAIVARWPLVLLVSKDSPFDSVASLVAYAKANPGKLSYSSFGNNTGSHLTGELFKVEAGIDILHVPYRGSGPSLADLMGGQIQLTFDSPLAALSLIEGGKLRALAVTSADRLPQLPNVPTLAQAGVKGVEGGGWVGILGPAKTPPAIVEKLNSAINDAVSSAELKTAMATRGIELLKKTPTEFERQISSDIAVWTKVAERFGITPR